MKWLFSSLFVVAWALWFGGAVATLLFVQHLFHYDRGLALSAAPQLFLVFEKYQLVLAAGAVISVAGIRRRGRLTAMVPLILVAAGIAIVSALVVTPGIERLRVAHQETTSEFRTLHGLSMLIYLIEVVVLLTAGVFFARPTSESAKVTEESSRRSEQ